MNKTKNTLFLLLAVLFQGFALVFVKQASGLISVSLFKSLLVFCLALFFLLLQTIVWQQVLRICPLFYAYLWMSLLYPLMIFLSIAIFREPVRITTIISSALIISGVVLINKE